MQRDVRETVMKYVFLISALISVLSIILIFYFIFSGGLPFILRQGVWEFLTGTNWRPTASQPEFGILPMIVGSLIVTGGAILIGVPIGVLTAVYMVFYCPKRYYRYAKSAINLMAAIPSIVYGFFALQIFVPFFRIMGRSGMNMVTASLLLGIMILPTIIGLSESAIRNVPKSYYQGAIGLGTTHERAILTVVVPAAKNGILSAIILGIGRAIGETMAVILVAGNQPRIPTELNQGVRTLTTNIVMEMAYATGQHREALIATAVVLFVFILIINLFFTRVKNKGGKR
ncbi:phosphate ABC transporter permease subunit PstC [Abiotrophia defectiva]|jgi:phosphate ABC transporter, permease protein pstC|uniref:Phosphate transport system permease protein n=1 Tax=Abiotrophia defectiva ATCC 49176 TaxID=592010 RepID=W1Q408_ABIDE|nr:phosphate ABC transporter permease subunit PstC [Abiotrophia defectiva]ESK65965.1 phosphate ABC transporter, permease protein PstC [Abiotrophia defectiva ATCC 49176]QKH46620.1 phosphate ABC transporter permease subunit PstC [Abiotrophia defectiva]RKW17744.1 MAG: phosphate ABC transporter permease subunit PstC [Catonella sp.]